MPTTFSRFIKNRDIFGHRVTLNFDKKGDKHQTLCGGITTIIYFLVIALFILLRFLNLPESYSLMDFLSYVGGILYFFYILFDYIISPIA